MAGRLSYLRPDGREPDREREPEMDTDEVMSESAKDKEKCRQKGQRHREETEQRGSRRSPGRAAGTAEMGAAPRAGVAEGLVWSTNQRPEVKDRARREGALRGKWERRNGGPKPL